MSCGSQCGGSASDDEGQSTIYTRRLKDGEFRLIRLLPAPPQVRRIYCELFITSYHQTEVPEYSAISYVWGDAGVTESIHYNGKSIEITTSLASALRSFRIHYGQPRILWADALCINQSDMKERSQQVSIMAELYQNAANVLVWLGHAQDDGSIQTAFLAMEYIAEIFRDRYPLSSGAVSPLDDEFCTVPQLTDAFLAMGRVDPVPSLSTFFELPYWQRVWCIQEAILARDLQIWCGPHTVHSVCAGIFVTWLTAQILREERSLMLGLLGVFLCAEQLGQQWADYNSQSHLWSDFLQLITQFRFQQASDPRDKIYGFLGLSAHFLSPLTVTIDYKKPYEKVYESIVKQAIRERGNLGVLSLASPDISDTKFPSWVPRWDTGKTNTPMSEGVYWPFRNALLTFAAAEFPSRLLNPNDINLDTEGTMMVSGVQLDYVTTTSDQMSHVQTMFNFLDTDRTATEWFQRSIVYLNQTPGDKGLQEISHEKLCRLATTFTGGATSNTYFATKSRLEHLDPPTEVGKQFLQDFSACVKNCQDPKLPKITDLNYQFMLMEASSSRRLFTADR